jgi:hypothetical protein
MYLHSGIVILSVIHSFFLSHGVLFLLVSSGIPAQAMYVRSVKCSIFVQQHPRSVRKCRHVGADHRKKCTYIVSSEAFLCGQPGEN